MVRACMLLAGLLLAATAPDAMAGFMVFGGVTVEAYKAGIVGYVTKGTGNLLGPLGKLHRQVGDRVLQHVSDYLSERNEIHAWIEFDNQPDAAQKEFLAALYQRLSLVRGRPVNPECMNSVQAATIGYHGGDQDNGSVRARLVHNDDEMHADAKHRHFVDIPDGVLRGLALMVCARAELRGSKRRGRG